VVYQRCHCTCNRIDTLSQYIHQPYLYIHHTAGISSLHAAINCYTINKARETRRGMPMLPSQHMHGRMDPQGLLFQKRLNIVYPIHPSQTSSQTAAASAATATSLLHNHGWCQASSWPQGAPSEANCSCTARQEAQARLAPALQAVLAQPSARCKRQVLKSNRCMHQAHNPSLP
jgi:hypothetical protein